MKDMVNQMLKVKNAISLLIICLMTSCASNRLYNKIITDEYSLERFKSKDSFKRTQIIFKCYDYKNRKERITQAGIIVNKVLLNSTIASIGQGKHTLSIGCLGKKTIEINNLITKRGDSIVIKTYMKDSNTVFID